MSYAYKRLVDVEVIVKIISSIKINVSSVDGLKVSFI